MTQRSGSDNFFLVNDAIRTPSPSVDASPDKDTGNSSRGAVGAPHVPAEQSLLLRYHKELHSGLQWDDLERASLSEGLRLRRLMDYQQVEIYLLDETTRMASKTFESLVAAVAMAHCIKRGHEKIFFSSGGNLSEAFALYARAAGIKTLSFNPEVNIPLMDGTLFDANGGHLLVGVRDAQRNRDVALAFSKKLQQAAGVAPLIPTLDWRNQALRCRGLFIQEYMTTHNLAFGAIAQTISAGFGPLAIFEVLLEAGHPQATRRVPRFIGVQQQANCYMYQRWAKQEIPFEESLIVPTLFDHNPDLSFGTYAAMEHLLTQTQGDLLTINPQEFDQYLSDEVYEKIRACGVTHTLSPRGEPLAKSGLMALAGVLKAIDEGHIRQGPVLVCMGDGLRPVSPPASCAAVVRGEEDLDLLVQQFLEL